MSVIALSNKKKKKFELAEIAYQLACNYDLEFDFCSQSVLAAVKDTVGVVTDEIIKAAHGLSCGGCLMGIGTCGALLAGLIAFSSKYGRDPKDFGKGQFMKGILKGRLLVTRFEHEYGGYSCNHLQKKFSGRTFDMWNELEAKEFKEKFCSLNCPQICGNVAKWVIELI